MFVITMYFEGLKEDWFCQLGHPRKIKNLLTYLIGARRRKPVNSHGILVTLKVIGHGIVKTYTIIFPHYVYMGDVTCMVKLKLLTDE